MVKSIEIDGGKAEVGDFVGFKADREQHGMLSKISGRELIIDVYDDNTGDVQQYWADKSQCWVDA